MNRTTLCLKPIIKHELDVSVSFTLEIEIPVQRVHVFKRKNIKQFLNKFRQLIIRLQGACTNVDFLHTYRGTSSIDLWRGPCKGINVYRCTDEESVTAV